MANNLESALIIALKNTLDWSAALPPLNPYTGTLTSIDPGMPFDVTQYARRDREFQHRDMVNAAAVAKVAIHSRTVWNGTMIQPVLQGVTQVTDPSGTNITLPLDPSQIGTSFPNSSTAVTYVMNADIPYASVEVTDVDLYNRDLLLYETMARAAAIFSDNPPITQIDPDGNYIGKTSIWATAQGTNTPMVPNSAQPMNQALFKDPDLYLAERDNQVAAYASRVVQALQNPFEFATRIYVQIVSSNGGDAEESETYVLTSNVFVLGNAYAAGDQVLYNNNWYQAVNTTPDIPPTSNWTSIDGPTKLQFMAEPTLDSRNRIVYDRLAKTLQWFRETPGLVHVPQIAGFYIPGILPDQTIETVPFIPEAKDAQFWRQKAARVSFINGTWSNEQTLNPTANSNTSSTYVNGGINALFESAKAVTLMMPDVLSVNFVNLICTPGTYALNCLVRPSPSVDIAGGDNQQSSSDPSDGGTTYASVGDGRNWQVELPAGAWNLSIEFANVSSSPTSFFGIMASQGATPILANTLPIYYTDAAGNPLPTGTKILSPPISVQSTGQSYNFAVQWTSGTGQLHITRLRFSQVNSAPTSHYIMEASWLNGQGTNASIVAVPGGDNQQGSVDPSDGGCTFVDFLTPLTWDVALSPGIWEMSIQYSNYSANVVAQMAAIVYQNGEVLNHLALPYTDSSNTPLPQYTVATSGPIDIYSAGSATTIGLQWQPASGPDSLLHVVQLLFKELGSLNSTSSLNVIGHANMPDVMPFQFNISQSGTDPSISVVWLPKSGFTWVAKSYNPGDQVLYNLIYWQATGITAATDIPGQSPLWVQLGTEPQIPLLFEQIQLMKYVETSVTPETVGFQGFRQDMLERALRADTDAYTKALLYYGTSIPEFRTYGSIWDINSTGSWMAFSEVYQPRLRKVENIQSGQIVPGHQYEAITQIGESITYNEITYSNGAKFYGVYGVTSFSVSGSPVVNQVGAYRVSQPGDVGKTGLMPDGLQFDIPTGTVTGWYPTNTSFPTHQAIQPWMIDNGIYVADDDLQSSDGNPLLVPAQDNPPFPHPPSAPSIFLLPDNQVGSTLPLNLISSLHIGSTFYIADGGGNFYSSTDAYAWTQIGAPGALVESYYLATNESVLVGVGVGSFSYNCGIATSTDLGLTWSYQLIDGLHLLLAVTYGGGNFVAVGESGQNLASSDGFTWTIGTPTSGEETLHGIAYGAGVYVAVGNSGVIYSSTNGLSWTYRTNSTESNLNAIIFSDGKFVAVGARGSVITSSDGISWTIQPTNIDDTLLSVAYGNGLYVVGTAYAAAYSSQDLITWTNVPISPSDRYQLALCAHVSGGSFFLGETEGGS